MKPLNHQEQMQVAEKEIYDLVKGEFTPEEASEIVNALFSKKINFHEKKIFSDEIRFGKEDQFSQKRIDALKNAMHRAKELLDEAKESGRSIQLNSTISIELI